MSKIGRNDPCACGSGRKYKLCCGAVRCAALRIVPAPGPASSARGCGPCTRCCDGWLEGEVRGHRMFPGQRCHFVAEGGCSVELAGTWHALQAHDVFVVPPWETYRLQADEDCLLFSYSDRAAQEALGFFREERT